MDKVATAIGIAPSMPNWLQIVLIGVVASLVAALVGYFLWPSVGFRKAKTALVNDPSAAEAPLIRKVFNLKYLTPLSVGLAVFAFFLLAAIMIGVLS